MPPAEQHKGQGARPPRKASTRGGAAALDQVREAARLRHLGRRTEQAYVGWIRRFVLFHEKRHPREMGEEEIRGFLSDLASPCTAEAPLPPSGRPSPPSYRAL